MCVCVVFIYLRLLWHWSTFTHRESSTGQPGKKIITLSLADCMSIKGMLVVCVCVCVCSCVSVHDNGDLVYSMPPGCEQQLIDRMRVCVVLYEVWVQFMVFPW